MESEKRAKRPRIGMSNREGATERYEKVEYRRWGEETHSVRHPFHLHQTSICKN